AEFEGKGKENYEYIHENKGVAQEVAVEEAEVKPVATESGVVAETAESAPIIEVWSEETREKLEQVLNVENITSDDVEKINEIVNLKNGIQPKEEPLLKFLAEHKELINEPKFFELSEKTGIEYDKPHFLETYNNMPGDIKNSGMKAEGFMEVFAGSKAKVSLGLKKLFNFTADPSWKIKTDGTVIIENAYAKKGLNILLTKEDIAVEKSRWWGSSKNLFKSDLNLESVSKAKSEVTRLYK
ncbi:hypothetical protein KAU19_00275, partial [Candidatus Parcubacteria bacterium]|nr:hypothetical protein [Candidatus Parcubacteria bacterium]